MMPDAGDQLREAPGGEVVGFMNLAAYTTIAIGYLLGVLTSHRLALGPFLLFTAINLAWVAAFQYLQREDTRPETAPLQLAAMTVLAAGALFCLPLGLGFDWLLPTLTTAVVALTCHWRQTMLVVATFVVASWAALALCGANWSDIGSALVQTTPAYLFAMIFSLVLRRQQLLRERAEDLAGEVSRSKSELERAHGELRERASQAEELAIARERNRMAREIHDTLGHYLTILAVQLETALKLEVKLEARDDPRLHAQLVEARRVAAECLAEVRRSVVALRPADLTAISLAEALRRLVAESEASLPGTAITLDVEGSSRDVSPELRVALYRCAQEALTNIRKHAAASRVLVRLRVGLGAADGRSLRREAQPREVELTVLDNGDASRSGEIEPLGDPNPDGARIQRGGRAQGFGLLGMRERIALLGGTVRAEAEPGKGWRVEVRAPLDGDHERQASIPPPAASPAASTMTEGAVAERVSPTVAVSLGAEG